MTPESSGGEPVISVIQLGTDMDGSAHSIGRDR